jgi:hypothetical protein
MIDNILLHQSNALDASDDVFRLIKRELLKDEGIQKDKKGAASYIRKVLHIYKKGAAIYIRKVPLYI